MVKKEFYENPRILRYPNTGFQKALNLFSILVLILSFLYPLLKWNQIPDTIITHWGFSGQPDGWGPKGTIWKKSKVGLSKHKNHADPYEISHDSRICRHYIPQCSGKKSEHSAYSPVSGLPFRFHDLFHYKKHPEATGKLPLRNSPLRSPPALFNISTVKN